MVKVKEKLVFDPNKSIFVFGSNETGKHGAGAAREAYINHGAMMYMGFGPQGDSFAIPTKDWQIQTLPIDVIQAYVNRFIIYARIHKGWHFKVTALGTGLAGIRTDVMANMFKYAPENCFFDTQWKDYLPNANYWGTFP